MNKKKIKSFDTDKKQKDTTNKELVEFFNEVNSKKVKKTDSKFKNVICLLALLTSFIYYITYINKAFNNLNYFQDILNATLLLLTAVFGLLALIGNKKVRNILGTFTSISIISLAAINIMSNLNFIKFPTLELMRDLKNISIIDAMKWAEENNIKINSIYEYSDNYKEGYIITQDISTDTILKEVKEVNIIVSDGPNYNKELILTSMVGQNINELIKFINDNHMQNVTINYETNNEITKDSIINQSIKGQIKRNDEIVFTVSLGNKDTLETIKLQDLTNKSEFDATLYLKKNGINYNISYDFSDTIKRGNIISQSIIVNTEVKPFSDTINLVISNGKKIIVPDFSSKNVDDVISWITNNNLKVTFNDEYHTTIENSKLIKINYQPNDIIEEETKIIITTSKGALTLPNFNSLAEFLNWASTYNIKYTQAYEYNNSVAKGNIISLSKATGDKVDPALDAITVKISYGAPVTIPNFVGKSKSYIASTCKNIGLSCAFYYTGYSATAADHATTQTIGAGNKVVSGTYMKIGLSNGPAKTFNIYIQSEWIQTNADATINLIRNNLTKQCPGVTFNFVKKAHNSVPAGFIHPDSSIQGGNNSFVQGRTYTITIVS